MNLTVSTLMYSWAQHCSKSWVSVWKNSKADELMRLWELSQPCSCMMWKVQLSLHPEEKLSSINLLNMFGGKVPHKLREFVLFMLLWTELKFSCCWFTEILQMNLLSFFLTFWDCFQVMWRKEHFNREWWGIHQHFFCSRINFLCLDSVVPAVYFEDWE